MDAADPPRELAEETRSIVDDALSTTEWLPVSETELPPVDGVGEDDGAEIEFDTEFEAAEELISTGALEYVESVL